MTVHPTGVPDNLLVQFTEDNATTAAVVTASFRAGQQLFLSECCTGPKSPNIAAILTEAEVSRKWTQVDEDGFFVVADPRGSIAEALKTLPKERAPGSYADPIWDLIDEKTPFVLSVDHHGDRAEEVCALRQTHERHFGCLFGRLKPAVLLSRGIDEDLAGATLAALGALPHPYFFDQKFPELPDQARDVLCQNFGDIIDTVEMVDLDPNKARLLLDTYQGRELLYWRESRDNRFADKFSAIAAIDAFRQIFVNRRSRQREYEAVQKRLKRLESIDSVPRQTFADGKIIAADLTGYDANSAFYDRLTEHHPFAVVFLGNFFTGIGRITFVARDEETAEQYLGKGGLHNFYPLIPGAGGRKSIGGASWSATYTFEQDAARFAGMLEECITNSETKTETAGA